MQKLLSIFKKANRLHLLETILFWSVVFLAVFIPLYPKFPLVNVSGTFVAIRLEDLFIFSALSLWIIYIFISGKIKDVLKDKLYLALVLFFFVGAVSLFSGIFLTKTAGAGIGFFHYLRRVELIMILPLVATVVKTKKQLIIILASLSVTVLLINIYAFGQQYLKWPVVSTTNSEFSKGLILYLTEGARVNSTFAGHYDLAVFLVMVLVIVTALFFATKSLYLRIWAVVLVSSSFLVLIMTAARLSFVAALVGIVSSLLLTKNKKYILLIAIIASVALIYPSQLRDRFISTITVNLFEGGPRYSAETEEQIVREKLNIPTLAIKDFDESEATKSATSSGTTPSDIAPGEPIDTTQLGVYRSFAIRLNLEWPRAINAFYKNPLLGTGYSSLGLATDNDFLRSLGEVGILGTIAFGLILYEATRRVLNNFRSQDKLVKYFSAGVLSLILAFLVNALFIDVFEASKIASLFWMILGLNIASGKFK